MSNIFEVDILDESKDCFLTYAEEVLTDRAIPAAEDGLLSAQRKILWTMSDYLKMSEKSKTKKSNAIVGSTLATSYYHGDAACYGVLCKMSQEFLMRYPLVTGQGSLGTQEDNNMVASSRYTEAKPSKYADLMMIDYKKNPVPTKETYNGEFMEPIVLPGLFPNAICNGRQAIGVSMAHNTLSHNLTEVCNAIIAYIDNNDLTIDELLQIMPGPDFPLGGTVINKRDIKKAFETGKSDVSLKVRGDYEVKDNKIIFTTIPYRTYRKKIKEQLEKNVEHFEPVLDDFEDESSQGKNKLIFYIKKGISAEQLLNKLFQYTDLQTTLSYNMNFIVNGTPKLCSMLQLIQAYIIHQHNVLKNIAIYDKDKAEKRAYVLEGLLIALEDIDTAIALIKGSNTKSDAAQKLIQHFHITEMQADAILDMKLVRLTRLNRSELLEELKTKYQIIEDCDKILTNGSYRDQMVKEKIIKLRDHYGDTRRTRLIDLTIEEEKEEIVPQDCVIILSANNTIKRVRSNLFQPQRRNTRGVKTQDDIVINVIHTNTADNLMVFTDQGKLYRLAVNNIPEGTNTTKGTRITSLINLDNGEQPKLIYSIHKDNPFEYIYFVTKYGVIKKTLLEEYEKTKKTKGIAALKLRDNDSLVAVFLANNEDMLIVTKQGMCARISGKGIVAQGRATIGVRGITLKNNDEVAFGIPIRNIKDDVGIFTTDGCGKRVKLDEFTLKDRGTTGIKCITTNQKIASVVMLEDSDNVLITNRINSLCISATEVPILSRTAQGNLMSAQKEINFVSKI